MSWRYHLDARWTFGVQAIGDQVVRVASRCHSCILGISLEHVVLYHGCLPLRLYTVFLPGLHALYTSCIDNPLIMVCQYSPAIMRRGFMCRTRGRKPTNTSHFIAEGSGLSSPAHDHSSGLKNSRSGRQIKGAAYVWKLEVDSSQM